MKCFVNNCLNQATDTHEIFDGANRKNSIKYKLQVRVCRYCNCHRLSRSLEKYRLRQQICTKLGLDYDRLAFIMRKANRNWTEKEQEYMDNVKEVMNERE